MKNWSLGRIDFTLNSAFELQDRTHSIYHVNVSTTTLYESTAKEIWDNKINQIKKIHIENKSSPLLTKEIGPEFPVAIYRDNPSMPELVKLEAQKQIDTQILNLKYEGQAGKEENIFRLLSITAEGYRNNIPYGFNVGAGSIISKPSRNEYASASFKEKNIEMKILIKTSGTQLNPHPLDDIEQEKQGLLQDGITLNILKNEERDVAGFNGYEGHVTLEILNHEPEFRFTWFTPGITADSFNPEILIKVHGPLNEIERFKPIWESLLESITMREPTK